MLESRIKQLEASLSSFQAQYDPRVKGKGRGKKSTAANVPGTSTQRNRGRNRTFAQSPSISSEFWTDDESVTVGDEEQTFFLKNVELTLNGVLIDQVILFLKSNHCLKKI